MDTKSRFFNLAIWTIFISIGVFSLKFLAYWLTQSTAFYSDALETLVNIVASVLTWLSIYIGNKPADYNHSYGHYKIEYLSAAVQGFMIFVVALFIFSHVGTQLYQYIWLKQPLVLRHMSWGMILTIIASLMNGLWGSWVLRVARQQRSPALEADGWHMLIDVITSIGVIIGVGAAYRLGWPILDPILAFLMALFILWQGARLLRGALDGLMDHSVLGNDLEKIKQIIKENARGAIEVHDLRTRQAGRVIFIEFHLVVENSMRVGEAHDICDRIELALEENIKNVNVVIHIEPDHYTQDSEGTIIIEE